MGCCLSHENRASQKQSLAAFSSTHEEFPCVSKSPPRPDEESVKEVLSETPNPKPGSDLRPGFKIRKNLAPLKTEDVEVEGKGPSKQKILLTRPVINPGFPDHTPPAPACSTPEEISDTVSESISNNTPREREEDELKQSNSSGGQIGYTNSRSQGQNGHNNNNFIHVNNRTLAAGRSPGKRAVRSGQRREAGENSGRRSRSPGNRGANVGRSPSGRRKGPSPGRVRMVQGPSEGVRKVVEDRERERERERE